MAIKVYFLSLGCPKNQTDTEVMMSLAQNDGELEIVAEDIEADVAVVNTCAFIEDAKAESIDSIIDLGWLKKNGKLKGIVVTGCCAQRYSGEIKKQLPEVDAIVGVGNETQICEAIKRAYEGAKDKFVSISDPDNLPLGGDRVITSPAYTAYLKIAEGCDNRCSYCVIPGIRGRFRSRTIEDIVEEAQSLYSLGVKELVLVAQDTTRYGLDLYGEYALPRLLQALCENDGFRFEWIRLMYCYPDKITDELIDTIAKYDCIAKYIDLPIQHINDRVLSDMNRHGGSQAIKDAVRRLREKIPAITIRTTVIVGFPGETQKEFEQLAEYVKETRFERLGVFCYSREENTPAASMAGQVGKKTAQRRSDIITEIQYQINFELQNAKIGGEIDVLCEDYDPVAECWYGRSQADAPEVDTKVFFSANRKIKPGDIVRVRIDDSMDYDLVGTMVK